MRTTGVAVLIISAFMGACRCAPPALMRPEAADWVVSPSSLTLPAVYVGQHTSAPLIVDNLGGVSQTAQVSIDAPFSVALSSLTLGSGESATITVDAVPTVVGVSTALLHLGVIEMPVSVEGLAIPECVASNVCTTAQFDLSLARCVTSTLADGTACDDGCVSGACHAGTCEGTVNACDDGDRCTTDACGVNGCLHLPLRCPAPSPCAAPTCDANTGCGVVEAPDGTLCGPDDCRATEVDVCIRGQCVTRPRPNTGRCVNRWVPATLSGRSGHALAWDETRGRVVLFGGYTSWSMTPETWEWNGSVWEIRTPTTSPPSSFRPAMAFDLARSKTVLIVPKLNHTSELWEWDGVTWLARSPASASPPTHGDPNYASVAVAYDVARHVTVVTYFKLGPSQPIDTWEWNGLGWRQRNPLTVPKLYYGAGTLTWDGARQRVVLIGTSQPPNITQSDNAVWEWDGNDWTDRSALATAVEPWGTFQAAPTWDADRRELVMKATGMTIINDGTRWRSQPANGPEPIGAQSPMVYDTVRRQLVLFDGSLTWTWDGTRWSKLTEDGSPELVALVTVNDAVLGFSIEWNSQALAVWRWDRRAWVPVATTGAPPGRLEFGVAYDAARDRLVIFGGTGNGNSVIAETWEFDGTGWARRTPAHQPPARKAASMAFDPRRQRVVLFGGANPMTLGDVWEWDGVDWAQLSNVGAPSARYDAPMIWDSSAARMLFISNPVGIPGVEAWSWDGTWTEITPLMPPARPTLVRAMADDPVRHRVLVIEPVSFNVLGTWEFGPTGWTQRMPTVSPGTIAFPLQGAVWDPVGRQVLISGVGQTWVFLP